MEETKKLSCIDCNVKKCNVKQNIENHKPYPGLTWAVQYPEKVFFLIDEQIRTVKWEESETLRLCFASLVEI